MGKLDVSINGELSFQSENTTEVRINGDTGAVALIEVPAGEKTSINIRTNGVLTAVGEEDFEEDFEEDDEDDGFGV